MLTQKDILQIESAINKRVNPLEERMEEKFERIENKIKLLPTKSEFFTSMSEVMGELKAIREEETVQSGILSSHSDRIEKLEQILPEP